MTAFAAQEIADMLNITKRAVMKRAAKEHWPYINNNGRGGQIRKYRLSDLPADIQDFYMSHVYQIDRRTAVDLAEHFRIDVPPEKLSDPGTATKIRMISECLAVPEVATGRRQRIQAIAESYGFNLGTAYRLMRKIKAGKPLYKDRNPGGTRFPELGITLRAWDEPAGRMAIEAILGNRRNKVERLTLYNGVRTKAEAQNLRIGTYDSFCWLARKIKANRQSILTYRDKGIQGLRQDVVPAIQRDPTAYRPMECLVGDQHKADYYALDTQGNVVTLELFCWLDFRTQLVWGAVSLKHYNRYTVGQALINAVRWGLPSIVYTDWGKPEESKYIAQLIGQLTGLGVTVESIEHVNATQRHPQAKPIEGWFGRLDQELKNEQIPGYCKRLKDSRENELQQKELKQQIKAGALLTVPELVDKIVAVIDRWNNHRFKSRGQDTGKSPLDIYKEETADHPVAHLAEDVLEYVFLPIRTLKIRRSQIRFKHDWHGRRSYYDHALADYAGREAEVRYDPFDPSAVWVFVDKKLVCQADAWGMINPKIKDDVASRMAEQKRLIKQIRDTYRTYLPPRKGLRRINPHEREAKQLKTVRVQRTQLELEEERAVVGGDGTPVKYASHFTGQAAGDRFRQMFSIEQNRKVTEISPARSTRPFMRLTIDDPVEED